MRKVAIFVALLACVATGQLTQASAHERTIDHCPDVSASKITGYRLEVFKYLNCSAARSILVKYFDKVAATSQVNGGCAQERGTKGCKIGRYRCFTVYSSADNSLEGECRGSAGRVTFFERDRGPN